MIDRCTNKEQAINPQSLGSKPETGGVDICVRYGLKDLKAVIKPYGLVNGKEESRRWQIIQVGESTGANAREIVKMEDYGCKYQEYYKNLEYTYTIRILRPPGRDTFVSTTNSIRKEGF